MKTILTSIAASWLAAFAVAQPPHPRYTLTDLGTLGGTYSYSYSLNNAGQVAGGSATQSQTDGLSQTAFLWSGGHLTNLGTLDGSACPACSSQGSGVSASGDVALISETSKTDPNGEDFGALGTHRQWLGAIWKKGVMTPLQLLPGGNNTIGIWINNPGQIIGWAENEIHDPTCASGTPFQVLRFEPVIWAPNGGIQQRLRPFPGDTVAFGFGINDLGQAVGSSGSCSTVTLPPNQPNGLHAVLWEKDGSVQDLGNLGGTSNIASSVNNLGQVVGTSRSSKDGTIHAFLWTQQTGMQDLGAFPGATATVAPCCHSINDKGEVVGFSIDATGNMRALLWQDKVPMDLNTFILAGSPFVQLQTAQSINDAGQIAGYGLTSTGDTHAFLATPVPSTTAFAGPKNNTVTARQIMLDGTASTSADGKPLTYVWSIPQGSPSAAILHGDTVTPAIQFTTRGVYTFQLTVTDSSGKSASDLTTVSFAGN